MLFDLVKIQNFYGLDDYGMVFDYGNNIYRGINPARADIVASYFSTGLIAELEQKNLIPKTEIVPHEIPQFKFILQHEKINNLSYAWEWSFTMMKDAALMCVDVMEVLLKHGFCSKDGHHFNIMFKDNKPVWVDITSFMKNENTNSAWSILEFFQKIYQPLELMTLYPKIARQRFKDNSLDWIEHFFKNLVCKFGLKSKKYFPNVIRRYYNLTQRQSLETDFEKQRAGLEMYRQKIKKLNLNIDTQWCNYHNNWLNKDGQIILSGRTRFLKILNIINSLPIKSVVEFAANQGMFSAMMATNNNIEKIVAVDYDENAVDVMYKLLSENRLPSNCVKKIFPMLVNFSEISEEPVVGKSLSSRIKADAVIALAMTHHLLLSQRLNIDKMFHKFSNFTNRFIFVEFMPLGLYWTEPDIAGGGGG